MGTAIDNGMKLLVFFGISIIAVVLIVLICYFYNVLVLRNVEKDFLMKSDDSFNHDFIHHLEDGDDVFIKGKVSRTYFDKNNNPIAYTVDFGNYKSIITADRCYKKII